MFGPMCDTNMWNLGMEAVCSGEKLFVSFRIQQTKNSQLALKNFQKIFKSDVMKNTSTIEISVCRCIFNIDALIHGHLLGLVLTPLSVQTDHISGGHYLHDPLLAVHSQDFITFHHVII